MTKEKDTGITSGLTIEDSKVGGIATNNTDLACTSALSQLTTNLDFGKWVNA